MVRTRGIIQIGDLKQGTTLSYTKDGMKGAVVKSWRDLFSEAYLNEDISFIRSIMEDKEPEVTGWDGMKAVEIVKAGNESIRTGQIVKL